MSQKTKRIHDAIRKAKNGTEARTPPPERASLPLGLPGDGEPVPQQPVHLELAGPLIAITRMALVERADNLDKLAKTNTDRGYLREGKVVKADALTIREHLLPLVRDTQLELATAANCRAGIAEGLRQVVARALNQEFSAGEEAVDAQIGSGERVDLEVLLGDLANRIEHFGRGCADRGYAMGHAAREQTAEVAVLHSLDDLRLSSTDGASSE